MLCLPEKFFCFKFFIVKFFLVKFFFVKFLIVSFFKFFILKRLPTSKIKAEKA